MFSIALVPITPVQKRYLAQSEMWGYLSNWLTFAKHVHVGMLSGDDAVALAKMLKPYLPILLALCANSPFWQGYDTGYASFGQRLLASIETYGMPPRFNNWQDFVNFFDSAKQARVSRPSATFIGIYVSNPIWELLKSGSWMLNRHYKKH